MKSTTYPLNLPDELYTRVKRTAERTHLSVADTLRQSVNLGLSQLERQLAAGELKPLTAEEWRKLYAEPDPEFDALAHHCANLPQPSPEEEE